MKKGVKITLIIGGLAVLGVGTGLAINAVKKKKKREEEERKKREKERKELQQQIENLEGTQSSSNDDCAKDVIAPLRNMNKDINNDYSEVNGVTLYPAQKSSNAIKGHKYASGYANIRNSPEVNNKTSVFDISNLIGKISSGKKIGTIIGESYDNQKPAHRWFKVKLSKKMEDCSGYTGGIFGCDEVDTGWVRADTVTFNPVKNPNCKSGFDGGYGKMVKRYKPVGVGVEVAPFYNWQLPTTNRFECGNVFD